MLECEARGTLQNILRVMVITKDIGKHITKVAKQNQKQKGITR